MKTKIIEMYRPSQYKSWEEANHMGGVYAAQVPEDTPYDTIAALVKGTRICMSADDLVAWRIKPVELTPFQQAFVRAYRDNVGVATPEQVEEFVRHPDANPRNMMDCEYYKLIEAHDMFLAGLNYFSEK
jgi:hypothetical protein